MLHISGHGMQKVVPPVLRTESVNYSLNFSQTTTKSQMLAKSCYITEERTSITA